MDDQELLEAEQLLRSTPWVTNEFQNLDAPKAFDYMFSKDPSLRQKHYVVGQRAPFIYKGPSIRIQDQLLPTPFRYDDAEDLHTMDAEEDDTVGAICTYAVYAGHYSINGSYMLQGGAVSAIFDYATACIGTVLFNRGSFALTKSVTTKFLKGAHPVPGVFKVIVKVIAVDLQSGSMTLHSTLTNDTILPNERPFAVSECVMIDGPRRKLFKQQQQQQGKGQTEAKKCGGNGGRVERNGTRAKNSGHPSLLMCCLLLSILCLTIEATPSFHVANVFGSHMVLQRDQPW